MCPPEKEQESKRAKLEREREMSKRARNEIIGRGDPVWSPVLLKRNCMSAPKMENRQLKIDYL